MKSPIGVRIAGLLTVLRQVIARQRLLQVLLDLDY